MPSRRESAPGLYDAALRIRAIANPLRLRLLHLLSKAEICHCHFGEVLQTSSAAVDIHLRALRNRKLITAERTKYCLYYRLTSPADELHSRLLELLHSTAGLDGMVEQDFIRLKSLNTCSEKDNACRSTIY